MTKDQSGSDRMTDTWPGYINKPKLPPGYEWVCLRRYVGLPDHPWWIRVRWTMKSGNRRMLKMPETFKSPDEAVQAALIKVTAHKSMRDEKDGQNG